MDWIGVDGFKKIWKPVSVSDNFHIIYICLLFVSLSVFMAMHGSSYNFDISDRTFRF